MDPKGRIAVPARFKDPIRMAGGKVFITWFEDKLNAYPPAKWEEIEQKFKDCQEDAVDMDNLTQFFIGGMKECAIDNQSRILIPQELRAHAKLKRDIVLIGQTDYFRICSRKKYDRDMKKYNGGIDEHEKDPRILKVKNIINKLVT